MYIVAAFMHAGMWVAQCPECPNAEKHGVCDDMSLGGLSDSRFTCRESKGGCGFSCAAEWPEDRSAIESLLTPRRRINRNWLPGESLADIRRENLDHGIREGV